MLHGSVSRAEEPSTPDASVLTGQGKFLMAKATANFVGLKPCPFKAVWPLDLVHVPNIHIAIKCTLKHEGNIAKNAIGQEAREKGALKAKVQPAEGLHLEIKNLRNV